MCNSTGDVLRELDSRNCIESDNFLVIDGGVITNIDLAPIWKEHEKRIRKSSYNVMTSVFSHMPYDPDALHPTELAIMIGENKRIIAIDNLKNKKSFSINTKALLENSCASVRFDLLPAGIYICGKEVLVHFSDNYDYNDICYNYLINEVPNIDFGYQYYVYYNDNSYSCFISVPL